MILVVSLNPALDITYRIEDVDWAGVNRPAEVHARPGGKGLNAARVLHALGADVLLIAMTGGHTGNEVRSAFSATGIPAVYADIAADTRRTFSVVSTGRGHTAGFYEAGPLVTAAEYARFVEQYRAALAGCSAVLLTGTLPGGLPGGTYAELIRMAADAGVPAVLDAEAEALWLGAAAAPVIVKPNLAELESAVGRTLPTSDLAGVAEAAAQLRDLGAGAAVVTLGADGLVAVTADGTWLARPQPAEGNPTGAGDAAAAALVYGYVLGQPWPELLGRAAALGAAAVAAPVAGEFGAADYERALAGVQVSRWEAC
ncbi:MAG TPA: hexose kinase [Streptosporangiaceae bacterium]|nr:hexose kinase [Streptosporangiaceae bacterium]